jgi:hypothetical protein
MDARDRFDHARILFQLHPEADLAYLSLRAREESMGDYGIEDIKALPNAGLVRIRDFTP